MVLLLRWSALTLAIVTGCVVGDEEELPPGDNDTTVLASPAPNASFVYYNANTKHASFADIEKSDVRNFNAYMAATTKPDLITLSEVGIYELSRPVVGTDGVTRTRSIHSCADVAADLSARVGEAYGCRSTGERGGAAVIYRKARFASADADVAVVNLETIHADGTCTIPAAPWKALTVRLTDKANGGRAVRVASIHLPTADSAEDDGTAFSADCSWRNLQRIETGLKSLGTADVSILGGDWNHGDATRHVTAGGEVVHDGWECTYRNATSADLTPCGSTGLGYRDVMFRSCQKACPDAAPPYGGSCMASCLQTDNWTIGGKNRIDFVLVKGGSLVREQATIAYSDPKAQSVSPTLKYSDHRAIRAKIYY
jgi:hypothetical protein